MTKKAQAAMEFLMTYGWAILVVLVVIGALAYFGVLNPTGMLPDKCFLEVGLNCKDYAILSDKGVVLKIENGKGIDLKLVSMNITGDGFACIMNSTLPELNAGSTNSYSVGCTGTPSTSGKAKAIIEMSYCKTSHTDAECKTFGTTIKGELSTKPKA